MAFRRRGRRAVSRERPIWRDAEVTNVAVAAGAPFEAINFSVSDLYGTAAGTGVGQARVQRIYVAVSILPLGIDTGLQRYEYWFGAAVVPASMTVAGGTLQTPDQLAGGRDFDWLGYYCSNRIDVELTSTATASVALVQAHLNAQLDFRSKRLLETNMYKLVLYGSNRSSTTATFTTCARVLFMLK